METATAHDALTELTQLFTNAQIAEVLGVVPETVSRLKTHEREPRGEVADRLDAFHYVVHRALSHTGGNEGAVRWAIFRRREELDGGNVAGLLREKRVDEALSILDTLTVPEPEKAVDLKVSAELDDALAAIERSPSPLAAAPTDLQSSDTERFLAEHDAVRGLLPHLVDAVGAYLGDADVELSVAGDEADAEELVVCFRTPLDVEESSERMRRFYGERWDDLLAPYSSLVSIAVE